MELKPGYKKTDVGVIPEDWDTIRGVQATSLITKGASPRWQGYGYTKQGMLFVTSENVRDGFLDISQPKYLPIEFHHKIIRSKISKNDILINLVGASIGRSCLVEENLGEANINQAVAVFRCNARMIPSFAAVSFQSPDTIARILGMQVDAARPNISLGDLRSFWLPLPPTPEQEAIAEALLDVDASIAALSRLIAKKRDLRQGAMQRLLTGQTRLPGFTAPWQEKRLGDHVAFLKNGIQSRAQLTLDDPVRYLHYGDIHVSADLCLDLSNTDMPRLPASAAAGLTRLQDGDVVFVDASEDLNGVGKSLEIAGAIGVEAVSGQHTIAARFDKFVLADGFKRYLQFIPAFTTHLHRLAAGTKVYATNRKHIASAELRLPKVDEQIAIARVLSDMELEISALETRLNKTRALKQAMMQALLTGRVRLPVRRDAAPQTKEAVHV